MTGSSAPHRSFWIDQLADPEVEPPIAGDTRADVAVMGGGYVGLWTAIRIKWLDPSCDVLVLEAGICPFLRRLVLLRA